MQVSQLHRRMPGMLFVFSCFVGLASSFLFICLSCQLCMLIVGHFYHQLPNTPRKPIYFSYAACGAEDEYTKDIEDACVNQEVAWLGNNWVVFS